MVYYGIRASLAIICSFGEAVFVSGIRKRFGHGVAWYSLLFLAASPGMFISATSMCPRE